MSKPTTEKEIYIKLMLMRGSVILFVVFKYISCSDYKPTASYCIVLGRRFLDS
jgi:hypothetical protein